MKKAGGYMLPVFFLEQKWNKKCSKLTFLPSFLWISQRAAQMGKTPKMAYLSHSRSQFDTTFFDLPTASPSSTCVILRNTLNFLMFSPIFVIIITPDFIIRLFCKITILFPKSMSLLLKYGKLWCKMQR